jgi:menaquinone-9 beta-reductase
MMRTGHYDAVVSGAGPAGSCAALVLARAGARVLLLDRARFPRAKLCGDTLNPGAMALLATLGLAADVEREGVPISGMRVTSGDGVRIDGDYGEGLLGRSIRRSVLDSLLVDAAVAAGATFEPGVAVVAPVPGTGPGTASVGGVQVRLGDGRRAAVPARVTIAADGRRSPLALALGLARHPSAPRRWAIGAYYSGVSGQVARGEMHVRPGHYVGVAPSADGLTNICVVSASREGLADPAGRLWSVMYADPELRDRCRAARRETEPCCLGPLALDVAHVGVPGLLLAGDAAGFVDPMTGDGMHLALHGGQLAAEVAVEMLNDPTLDGVARLARRRREAFTFKLRFNRALRTLVGSPMGVRLGAIGASLLPFVLRRIIATAGDVGAVRRYAA